jgi:hypothetical protein
MRWASVGAKVIRLHVPITRHTILFTITSEINRFGLDDADGGMDL